MLLLSLAGLGIGVSLGMGAPVVPGTPVGPPHPGPPAVPSAAASPGAELAGDPLAEARELLEAGLPVAAARHLSRALSEGRAEGAEALLLAARAHAEYGAWPSVRRLLGGQPWLDEEADGEGRHLLALAYLRLDSAETALRHYRRLPSASYAGDRPTPDAPPGSAPPRLAFRPDPLLAAVGHAEALTRLGEHQEAAARLLDAAAGHPEVGAWLRFEALGPLAEAGDTAAAGRVAAALRREPALPSDSVRGHLALAAFQAGDSSRGLELAEAVSGPFRAALDDDRIGPALLAEGDTSGAVRAWQAALAAGALSPDRARTLLELDSGWEVRAQVGRADLRAGRRATGRQRLAEALERAPEAERPELVGRLAAALRADGEYAAAWRTLSPWLERTDPTPERRATLWLEAYRALSALGRRTEAEEALERAAEIGAEDPDRASDGAFAGYLLADRRHDRGDWEGARNAYEATLQRFPRSRLAELALARLGVRAFTDGRPADAAERFETYRRRYPAGEWTHGALYWAGRAREADGDTAAARALYLQSVRNDPLGYYGWRAADRIGADPWAELAPTDSREPLLDPASVRLLERMEVLRRLGWTERARAELRAAPRASREERPLALALALNRAGWTRAGVSRAWAVRARSSGWSLPLLRAVYPFPYREALTRTAADRGLDTFLVAAVARRESMFDREIVSSAGAVGLLQLLPSTAGAMARQAGLSEFREEQLTVPEVNLRLGVAYLADMLERFEGSRVAALISYNAGPHRWLAWRTFPEVAGGEEALVERIPFRETREYVRAILAMERIYRALYASEPGTPVLSRSG